MRRVFGPRTVVEAVFLVAVPVIALVAGQSPAVIIASAAVGYLLVILFEIGLWRLRPEPAAAVEPGAAPVAERETVRVLPPEPAPAPAPEPAAAPPAPVKQPAPQPEPQPEPTPEQEHVRVLRPVPTPEPEPAPVQVAAAAPQPQTVVPIGVGAAPQQWNLWDLERLTREHAGRDEMRDEERSFLLMYLREFAGPDGLLPIDFDGLVRDSFGDLVGAR